MSDAAAQEDLIQQWMDVNCGTKDQARFYLEANNWDLNAALENFYESPPMSEGLRPPRQEDAALPLDPNLVADAAPVVSAGPIHAPAAAPLASASVPRRRHGSGARIATLSSLGNQGSVSDDEDAQEWYTGGEHSGMAVQPPQPGQNDDEGGSLVDRILRRASEGGPAAADPSEAGSGLRSEQPRVSSFIGRGRKLGDTANAPGGSSGEHTPSDISGDELGDADDDEIAIRQLTFWRNGFSIGDGPLYNLEDPANRQNLDAILQGRAPLDILDVRPGQRVEMRIANRRDVDYIPPAAPPSQPFSGQGRRLGAIAPSVDGQSTPGAFPQSAQAPAGQPIVLDSSQPTVQVQIRLADGARLVARANPSHTIGDLRAYVISQRPETAQRPFAFKTMMPPKVLNNDATSIKDAGIANAAIAQYFV